MGRSISIKGALFLKNMTHGNKNTCYLSFFDAEKDILFSIKCIRCTCDVPIGTNRGMHAHKTLHKLLWCPFGEIEVVSDDGKEKKSYLLDSPKKALLVLKGYWHDIYWKKEESVLCVAASDYYDEDDYIRDYDEFLKYVQEGYWDNEG